MTKRKSPLHVAIVGAYGSAGAAVADELAGAPDVKLTLIDDGDPGGGLCILRGCMPSKEVISTGAHRFQARHDDRLAGTLPEVDLEAVVDTKDEHTGNFAAHRRTAVHDIADREHVEFIHDTARFLGDRILAVGDRTIEPDYIVIATGSTVNVPDLPGIDDVDYMTSADVLDATDLPDSGIVVGFGYVGLELVPYIAEAGGTDLTVVEHDARPVDEADPAFGDAVLDIYREQFDVDILTHTYEQRLEPTADGGVRLYTDKNGAIEAEQLFLFTGRRPNLDRLGLENTALSPNSGWVEATRTRPCSLRLRAGCTNPLRPRLTPGRAVGTGSAGMPITGSRRRASRQRSGARPFGGRQPRRPAPSGGGRST